MISQSQSENQLLTTGRNKTCVGCEETKDESRFELSRGYRINLCRRCRSAGKRKKISRTPYSYIAHLFSHICSKRKDTHGFNLDREDLYRIYDKQKGLCAITNMKMTHIKDGKGKRQETMANISIDRIDNYGPYAPENIQLVCFAVNIMKHTHSMNEFLKWCKLVSKNN